MIKHPNPSKDLARKCIDKSEFGLVLFSPQPYTDMDIENTGLAAYSPSGVIETHESMLLLRSFIVRWAEKAFNKFGQKGVNEFADLLIHTAVRFKDPASWVNK